MESEDGERRHRWSPADARIVAANLIEIAGEIEDAEREAYRKAHPTIIHAKNVTEAPPDAPEPRPCPYPDGP
jgi:hypothetical protein